MMKNHRKHESKKDDDKKSEKTNLSKVDENLLNKSIIFDAKSMKSDDSKTTDTIDDALPSEDPLSRTGKWIDDHHDDKSEDIHEKTITNKNKKVPLIKPKTAIGVWEKFKKALTISDAPKKRGRKPKITRKRSPSTSPERSTDEAPTLVNERLRPRRRMDYKQSRKYQKK